MHVLICRCLVLTLLLVSLSPAVADDVVRDGDRSFRVPTGGGLIYTWHDDGDGPQIVEITYTGSAEWLVRQDHPRSHWHELPVLDTIVFKYGTMTPEQMEYVASLEQVVSLKFDETVFADGALTRLKQMANLKYLWMALSLHVSQKGETDADFFAFVEKLEGLEALSVLEAPVCEETFLRISSLEKLRSLNLSRIDAGPEALEKIANLSSLQWLSISQLKDPTPLLRGLRGHPMLATLDLEARPLDDVDVELIGTMTALEELHLYGVVTGSLAPVDALAELKTLRLPVARLGDADVAALARLTSLETLRMDGEATDSLTPLEALTSLRELRLSFDEYPADDFRWIANAPQLERLDIRGIDADEFPLDRLRGHEGIRSLTLPDAVLREEDIGVLESIPHLESLSVGNRAGSSWYRVANRRLPDVVITGHP